MMGSPMLSHESCSRISRPRRLIVNRMFTFHTPRYILGVDGEEKIYHRGWLLIIERVISQVKDELKAQGREGEFIGARVSCFQFFYLISSNF